MNALVSVIIPSYNSAWFVREAVDSALAQTYKNIEVIVVDDGSTDDTTGILKPYLDRIQYIRKDNGGPASARNAGIRAAKGEFVAFLDADDIWLPEKVEKQLAIMSESEEVGLVACGEYQINEQGTMIGQVKYCDYLNKKQFVDKMIEGNLVGGGSSSLVRKACFDKLGMFDEDLFGTEDWDMWLRIAFEYEVRFIPDYLFKARLRPQSVSSPANAERMLQNELKVLKKLDNNGRFIRRNSLKQKSFALRYFSAAKALKDVMNFQKSWEYVLKATTSYPGILFDLRKLKTSLIICMKSKSS